MPQTIRNGVFLKLGPWKGETLGNDPQRLMVYLGFTTQSSNSHGFAASATCIEPLAVAQRLEMIIGEYIGMMIRKTKEKLKALENLAPVLVGIFIFLSIWGCPT